MRLVASLLLASCIFFILPSRSDARPSMAFGYLANKSNDANFNYLETIFPNSFASSLLNVFDIDVVKPHAVNEILAAKNISLKKEYEPYELSELARDVKSDVFVYGDFTPLPNNRIKIVLKFYTVKTDKLFTFTNVGRMETEIFKLVDRITQIIISYMDSSRTYRIRDLKPGTRMAIVSNLTGEDLNLFYGAFMDRGYGVSGVQGNTLRTGIDDALMDTLKFIHTRDNSFDIITDRRNVAFKTGTWASVKHAEDTTLRKEIYKKYDADFESTKSDILSRLRQSSNNTIEYLLIVGFNPGKTSVWVRCIDVVNKDLVWMQDILEGKNIADIGYRIIDEMSGAAASSTHIKDRSK